MLAFIFFLKPLEAVWTLFIIAVAVLFPLILIGGVVFYVLQRNKKNLKVWKNLARKLNLQMPNPKQLQLLGTYNGCEVKTAIRVERVSGSESNSMNFFTYCTAEFSQPLRFLLEISSMNAYFFEQFMSNKISLGHTNFDKTFTSQCYDANILRSFLLSNFPTADSQSLFSDLMLASQSGCKIKITDKSVYLERNGIVGDENVLQQMIEITAHLGNRFKAARKSFPLVEWEKSLIENWQNLANENNLQFDFDKFNLRGNYKNFPLSVDLITDKKIWQTIIKLNFPRSLMVGLKLMPENSIHSALTWLGVQDIEIGIKEFDNTFIVKGKNIQMAKHLLQPDVCQQLLILNKNASALLIDDEAIAFTYDTLLGDKNLLKSNIEGMLSTAKKLLR